VRSACWIGIDPSYSGYGLARINADESCHVERLVFTPELTGTGSVRLDIIFRVLQDKFETIYACHDVKAVAVEGYAPGAKFGREMAGEIGGITRILSMREFRRRPLVVAPSALKKFATGGGKGVSKEDVMAAVESRWGERFKSDDEADAYVLARVAMASTKGATEKHEKEVLAVVAKNNRL